MVTVIKPIVPGIGKKYYATILGLCQEGNPYALIPVTVYAIGMLTVTLEHYVDGRKRDTYRQGDVCFIEEVATQPEKAN